MRCVHEKQQHAENCYITLTYNDQHIRPDYSLHYEDFQKFMRRLRKHFAPAKIRFYMAGEYGESFTRPHFHAILFGIDFADKLFFRKNHNGDNIYTSAALELLWQKGFSSVGAVTFQSAAYVARYVMKKITGDLAASHYTYIDQHGEIHERVPEFNHMSLKPGIGATWYEKFHSDVFPADHCITNGFPSPPPRYYEKKLEQANPDLHEVIKKRRKKRQLLNASDNTPRRLRAKEQVAAAKLAHLKRTLS